MCLVGKKTECGAHLGGLWLACELSKLLPKDLLFIDVQVLVSEENNPALRDYSDSQ
jgi:hypothetical protein